MLSFLFFGIVCRVEINVTKCTQLFIHSTLDLRTETMMQIKMTQSRQKGHSTWERGNIKATLRDGNIKDD